MKNVLSDPDLLLSKPGLQARSPNKMVPDGPFHRDLVTYVKRIVPIPKLCVEHFDQLAAKPPALGVCLVLEEVWLNFAKIYIVSNDEI